MHEMSIAASVLDQVESVARDANAVRVISIELELGAMQLVVPDALTLAWSACCEGTVAEGSVLEMNEIAAAAKCRLCGHSFEPDITVSFMCPECLQADVEIIGGNDIVLKSVSCDAEESVETR